MPLLGVGGTHASAGCGGTMPLLRVRGHHTSAGGGFQLFLWFPGKVCRSRYHLLWEVQSFGVPEQLAGS